MQFFASAVVAVTAFVSLATANSVYFVNQDSTTRTIFFSQQEGLEAIGNLVIKGHKIAIQDFPTGWIGNFYSVSEGKPSVTGMLGEVRFDGYAGDTYFDVSAIVNPDDNEGVKMMFPLKSSTPSSGCQEFPCSNAYNKPDDVATQATSDTDIVCLLGNLGSHKKRASKVSREFLTGSL